ncbi:hypothetical protein LLH23_00685 [bacterium]|nr:hypothetical protein [bacterium]
MSDRDVVRSLAAQLAEAAHSDEMAFRRRLWRDVHSLRLPERSPVICHAGCWHELIPASAYVCRDPWLRQLEAPMRQSLYKLTIGDDTVINPYWEVATVMELQGEHFWGLPIGYTHPDVSYRGAWAYDPPLKSEADLERIVPPRYVHNERATQEALERTAELLGDILPVQRTCTIPTPGAWLHGWATQLRGVTQLLVDMMDRPEWVHRLMAALRDGNLALLDQYEQQGVLTPNTGGLWACDGLMPVEAVGAASCGAGPTAATGPAAHDAAPVACVRLKDLWGRGESQEFQGVGPAQYEEFLLNYQEPILARFGLTYYGCCEDLTNKIPLVLSIPNLRKFVCSAWTNLEKLVEAVGDRYCIEWRQKATDVVFTPTMGPIREHLRRGLTIAKGTPLHIVLQELETVDGRPERLREWAEAAKEIGASL